MRVSNLINKFGKLGGWNDVTMNFLGRDVEGITDLEYDDELDIETVMGQGAFPIGYGEGNYKAKASFTLYNEEWNALQMSLPAGSPMSFIAPFPVIVEYDYNGFKKKDVFTIKIKGRGVAVKQGDKTIAYKANVVVLGKINWNV